MEKVEVSKDTDPICFLNHHSSGRWTAEQRARLEAERKIHSQEAGTGAELKDKNIIHSLRLFWFA